MLLSCKTHLHHMTTYINNICRNNTSKNQSTENTTCLCLEMFSSKAKGLKVFGVLAPSLQVTGHSQTTCPAPGPKTTLLQGSQRNGCGLQSSCLHPLARTDGIMQTCFSHPKQIQIAKQSLVWRVNTNRTSWSFG